MSRPADPKPFDPDTLVSHSVPGRTNFSPNGWTYDRALSHELPTPPHIGWAFPGREAKR